MGGVKGGSKPNKNNNKLYRRQKEARLMKVAISQYEEYSRDGDNQIKLERLNHKAPPMLV